MKVLFAVNNENISESIVKKYQKQFKEIISYKNVYYFNAILKEIQKDKTYDRIVISEDLEQFTNTSYEQMDKFIFERLDSISDEASNIKGEDIPIILICSERRTKSDATLVKFFGIGIYNAIIGNDRSIDEVCRLINKPRLKKEAKQYYKIDTEEVKYQAESENDVSELEIQNILAYFKRLGKNEDRYIDSFNNIAAQYNDNQLRVISKFLPLGVRAVLEEKSPKYQQVMSFNNSVSKTLRYDKNKKEENDGLSQTLLKTNRNKPALTNPIVVPTAMKSSENVTKLTRKNPQAQQAVQKPQTIEVEELEPIDLEEPEVDVNEIEQNEIPVEAVTPTPKKRRGRPRKNPLPETAEATTPAPKKKRGRPRKNPLPEPEELTTLPGLEEDYDLEEPEEEIHELNNTAYKAENAEAFPNIEEENEEEMILPGIEEEPEEVEEFEPQPEPQPQPVNTYNQVATQNEMPKINPIITKPEPVAEPYNPTNRAELEVALQGNKKIATFVGTSKNGTSFIVNNLAQALSTSGVNVAILDTTTNRNAYYIYTKNEEQLRNTAITCIDKLVNGIADGIKVNANLTVYTSLPNEGKGMENVVEVLTTLAKNHTVVLIDSDFNTPKGYFAETQELYLVQTMDVLTIQPLTAFLKDLIAQHIIDEQKIRVVINKHVRMKAVSEKEIIGGMAYYNDPAMTFMTGLFDRNTVKYISIPFEEEIYVKYLEGLVNCEISLKGYSKVFMQSLRQLGGMVYPIMSGKPGKGTYRPPTSVQNGGFSSNINNTLSQMKRKY